MMPFSALPRMVEPHAWQHEDGADDAVKQGPKIVTGRNLVDYVHPQSNTTLANVPGLYVDLEPNSVYRVWIVIASNSGATPDTKLGCVPPSGATGYWFIHLFQGGVFLESSSTGVDYGPFAVDGLGAVLLTLLDGIVITGAAGSFQVTAAQNTSTASDTTIKLGSSIVAVKVN
jgi:hypothetical protein